MKTSLNARVCKHRGDTSKIQTMVKTGQPAYGQQCRAKYFISKMKRHEGLVPFLGLVFGELSRYGFRPVKASTPPQKTSLGENGSSGSGRIVSLCDNTL